jgi:predicted ATPase
MRQDNLRVLRRSGGRKTTNLKKTEKRIKSILYLLKVASHCLIQDLIFIGACGTGKGDLLGRLQRLGYSTIRTPFLSFYKVLHTVFQLTIQSVNTKDTALVSSKWVESQQESLHNFLQNNKKESIKDNVVFVNRSVLSPLFHETSTSSTEQLHTLMNRIKQV